MNRIVNTPVKRMGLSVALLLVATVVLSQPAIRGRVVNAATGEPLAGTSVFISNTSIGTVTDNTGSFVLNHIPPGRYDLITSSVGYETNVFSFSADQLPLQLKVEMTVKVKELENVIVEPYVEEGWDRWGRVFLENFIGRTPNARHCRIKNESAIRFRYYKRSNRVVAFCDEPVIIENKALGYNLRYQLEDFEVSFKEHSLTFSGYPFFEEIDKDRKNPRKRWSDARDKAYYGSMMHFLRSLYTDSLQKSGFEVRRMVRVPNTEKERVKRVYKDMIGASRKAGENVVIDFRSNLPSDSSDYYNRVMRQNDYVEIYGKELLNADSLIVRTQGADKFLFFTDYLYITYKNEKEEQEYLVSQGESNRQRFYQRSYIWLVSQTPVVIDINGAYYPPQELFSMAYWGWSEKISDLLPQDYAPGEE